ncbi:BMC domain-containing protein [Anaerocolumna sedimenticola]|uniref:BMC domain-containing protein n=1 Tax=Anaerocolumna sedimenticola TaxID=2696063 RepID=A0A6P1TR01_9FIRM|nr:BMC domain-containing protein [Anaerocolumna sedimenticola]QHQ61858.1 BMC domain-containing protein [Anaerocolumna sedimenticola]
MSKAIGMVEYKTVSTGLLVADTMLKTAQVEIIEAQTVCPGKYIVLLRGDLSAINACIETARTRYSEHLIDSFILGNPHESIFAAIYGATQIEKINALGILETFSAASIIVAADEAAKTAQVELIELRIARGMCGKSYLLLTGEVAAVEAAIAKAKAAVGENAMLLDSAIIANPDDKLCKSIL